MTTHAAQPTGQSVEEKAFLEKANLGSPSFNFQPKTVKKTNGKFHKKFREPTVQTGVGRFGSKDEELRPSTKSDFDPKGEQPVKIGSLLGLEQVGQCIFIEYGGDMILVDCGLEFNETITMGADYLIPDISYVQKNIKKLKGILLTHGHLDHIGALKDILPQLDFAPTIYTTPLTLGLVKKTLEERKTTNKLKFKIVNPDVDLIKIGCFDIEFVRVNHNIPETFALSISTPKGTIFTSADFKIDHTPAIDKPADLAKIARIGTEGVKLYIGDSLGADKPGRSRSEKVIGENLDGMIKHAPGRLIISMFASNVGRIIQAVHSAIKYNKTVFLAGRSMINYTEVARELGYINVPKNYLRKYDVNTTDSMTDDKTVILCTGAQGEEFSFLARAARGENQQFKFRSGDTVIVSSNAIPGNETQMAMMLNQLLVKGVNLLTNNDMDIHASGHGHEEDHKLMLGLIKPEFFLPYYMPPKERYAHRKLGLDMGIDSDKIIMPDGNGTIIEMYNNHVMISKQKMKLDTVIIDGKGIGGLHGEYVSKARKIMSESGMLTFIVKIDSKSRAISGNIQIESRGFVYTTEIKKVHTDIVQYIEREYSLKISKYDSVKQCLKDIKSDLEMMLEKSLDRVPLIIPMFVYVGGDNQIIEDTMEMVD
ncbi:MAG TPA: ribonuclease J [Candidatus Absconditabacterales bacterium]|nr:ribonuclease J [Candidatus Absconditabacterales bacterium]HNG97166.1 ribonuclease J [Candidatus Absconditabacterales bacterium]